MSEDKNLLIISIYISPHPGEKIDHFLRLITTINLISKKYTTPPLIIGGNFNIDLRKASHELKE